LEDLKAYVNLSGNLAGDVFCHRLTPPCRFYSRIVTLRAEFKRNFMKNWMFLSLLCLATQVFANTPAALEENLYFNYQKNILSTEKSVSKSFQVFTSFEQKIFVDALENLVLEGNKNALETLQNLEPFYYELIEQFRIGLLKIKTRRARTLTRSLANEVELNLQSKTADLRLIYLIAANESELKRARHYTIVNLAQEYPEYEELNFEKRVASAEAVRDLFYRTPALEDVLDGTYTGGVKIFMFCRTNRLYPCLMLMKDRFNEPVRLANGELWTHKSLASAKTGYPSYQTNGNTPAGIMTIDSVMPVADQQISFGKFRRMILDFIPNTQNESLLMSVLPESSRKEDWWKPGAVARDVGRSLFRIHGTLKRNTDESSTFWPFMQTSGCIAQRENTYGDVTFQDQRDLLDMIMLSMGLTPEYSNETKVKGLIYITEIDSKNAAVTLADLHARGIQ
jgi:hypothetical protein